MSRYFAGEDEQGRDPFAAGQGSGYAIDWESAQAHMPVAGPDTSYLVTPSWQDPVVQGAQPAPSGGGFLDSIASMFKSIATGTVAVSTMVNRQVDIYGRPVYPGAAYVPGTPGYTPPVSTTPPWLIPAAIGGGVLVLLLVLKSRRSSVAGYRRRKHRRNRR